ncbi:MAG: hypothetical protein JWM91_2638 [Rhodospirillales bacterium]|jgi:hypothetical protein|nr:hypothetical protein [Rhodospirillales bacterium]
MVWEFVWVVIPLVAIIGGFITKWHRTNVEFDLRNRGDSKAMEELRDAVLRLESRVANLERAVTTAEADRKYASL